MTRRKRQRNREPKQSPNAAQAPEGSSRPARVAGGLAAAATGVFSLAVYITTLPPTVLGWDDGEFAAVTRVLGIAHPTGYPLYILLAKLFYQLPFANPAVRLSALSALCGACAAATIAWCAASMTRSLPAGVLAGLIAAFNQPLWSQASRVEVYALSALVVALAMAVFQRWSAERDQRHLVWLGLLTGLGLAHHRTAIFFTGPLLLVALTVQRAGARRLLQVAAVGAAPLLFYLYLPIRAAAGPPVMWQDTARWDVLLGHVLGKEYYYHAFGRPFSEMVPVAYEVAGDFAAQLTPGGLVLAAIGLGALLVLEPRVRREGLHGLLHPVRPRREPLVGRGPCGHLSPARPGHWLARGLGKRGAHRSHPCGRALQPAADELAESHPSR